MDGQLLNHSGGFFSNSTYKLTQTTFGHTLEEGCQHPLPTADDVGKEYEVTKGPESDITSLSDLEDGEISQEDGQLMSDVR